MGTVSIFPDRRSSRWGLDTLSDEELVRRAVELDGDERGCALETLYRRHYDTVLRWALRLTGDEDEALDLAQSCFLKAHRSVHRFDGRSRFSTWLYTILRRTWYRSIETRERSRRHLGHALPEEETAELVSTAPDPQQRATRQGESEQLARALEVLDPLERRVVQLRFGAGMQVAEISGLLGLDNRTGARATLQTAMRKLRRSLHPAQANPGGHGS